MVGKFLQNIAGVAAVEFALIVPALMLMAIGIFDAGVYLNQAQRVKATARAAAQYVVQGGDINDIGTDVIANSNLGLTQEEIDNNFYITTEYVCECESSTVACNGSCPNANDYLRRFIEVTITLEHTPYFDYMALPDSYTIDGYARLQVASP